MSEVIVERLTFVCPFCGKRAAVVDVLPAGDPGIVHDKPECKEFDECGPIEFLVAVNAKLRGRMN